MNASGGEYTDTLENTIDYFLKVLKENVWRFEEIDVIDMAIRYILFIFLLVAFVSCKNNSEKRITGSRPGKNEMADLNRYFVQKDRERIQNYIERKNLKMKESPYRTMVSDNKRGRRETIFSTMIKLLWIMNVHFLMELECYSSKNLGPKEVIWEEVKWNLD